MSKEEPQLVEIYQTGYRYQDDTYLVDAGKPAKTYSSKLNDKVKRIFKIYVVLSPKDQVSQGSTLYFVFELY